MAESPVVEVKDVYKSFKTVQAVRGVNLNIMPGQFTALLGPNGAGKTTLVEMIEGIQKPDKGEIMIMGKRWKGNETELRHLIGLSLQETYFIDKLTVKETLMLFASFFNLDVTKVKEIISLVGLEEKIKSYVVNLSGGQRQRLALGIALLNNPKILLLDEPTTGLDPNARQEVWNILLSLRKKWNTSLVLTTHYMEEAEKLCDYIIIIDKGKILKEGNLEQLLQADGQNYKTLSFTLQDTDISSGKLLKDAGYSVKWDHSLQTGSFLLSMVERELPVFLSFLNSAGIKIKNLEIRKKTLDDVFISLTGRHLNE